jgi:O-antigen ligase
MKRVMIFMGLIAIPVMINKVVFKADGGVEEVLSMTGRLPFWKALLNEGIVKEPFFGYGFMRINYTEYFQGLNTYAAKMTHNTFIQVLMNLGFVGFFIAILQMFTTIRNFRINKKGKYAGYFIALFIPLLINSFTEFGVFGEANYGILFYQFLIWLFVMKRREHFTQSEKVRAKIFEKKMVKYGLSFPK